LICCADYREPEWRWLEGQLSDTGIRFEIAFALPQNMIERNLRFLKLWRVRGSFEAVRLAQKKKADAIVSTGPFLAAWCGLFARLLRLKIPLIADRFNFTQLPHVYKRPLFGWMLSD
jgi:hypothetical protein